MKKFLKILAWTAFGLVLFAVGLQMAIVNVLKPERLTPLVETVANRALLADVSVAKVELRLRGSYPFLNLQVDSLVVISRDIADLPAAARDTMPQWADTLATVASLRGGINLAQLSLGRISLSDVEIVSPQINLLVVDDSLNNFSIAKPSVPDDEDDDTALVVPDVRIKSFRIVQPRQLRYADLASGTQMVVDLSTAEIVSQPSTRADLPAYRVDLRTNIESPLFQVIGLEDIPIRFDGVVDWRHDRPYQLTLTDFEFAVSDLSGQLDASMDFTDQLRVDAFDLVIDPVPVGEVLKRLPEATAKEYGIPLGIDTDARVALKARLTQPFVAGAHMVPFADIEVEVPDCSLLWGKVDLRRLGLKVNAQLAGDDLNGATMDIERLVVAGPATTLDITGRISEVLRDPLFDGKINGVVHINRLPPVLTQFLGGGMAKGTVNMATEIKARPSMFSRDNFHRLIVRGTIDANDLYYLASDTLSMYYIDKLQARFGTNETIEMERRRRPGSEPDAKPVARKADSLLTASVKVDSAQILTGGLRIAVGHLSLGVGAQNKNAKADTTAIIPMGGRLSVGSFSLFTLSDSAGVRVRNLDGSVSMQRYKGNSHLPLFRLNAKLGRLSTGDNSTRLMVTDASLNARINKLPDDSLSEGRRKLRHLTDSIHRARPDLDIDSVYVLAAEIRRPHSTHKRHVRVEMDQADNEVIEWGTSRHFQNFLLDWDLRGTLTAKRARLFTSAFPVRNRLRNLNIKFNNDSIRLTDLEFKAGHSDFLVSGTITNMKRAFTSRNNRAPLRLNFNMLSDTIDINELANAVFVGAANKKTKIDVDLDDESAIDKMLQHEPDSAGPVLIPVNIDAEFHMRSNNVLYADFVLHNFEGAALAYDGALNLHNLQASSDVGAINLSALYSAPTVDQMKFGMAMKLDKFNIHNFLEMVPAVDSLMPMIRDFGGIIDARIAATSDIDQRMDLVLPTLSGVVELSGDSLVLLDPETFKTVSKWLMFKNKNQNMIKHMAVEMAIDNNVLQIYPFMFDFDRYRLGVLGHNDLALNYNYHIAVLKSPLPFKFGINVTGQGDKYKIRLGRARFDEKHVASTVSVADTTRVNLIEQFENVFRRGVRKSDFARIKVNTVPTAADINLAADTLTRADSLMLMREGLIPQTPALEEAEHPKTDLHR